MALSTQKTELLPPRITIYGEGGKGKTTFGALSESPIFVPTEKGLTAFPDIPQYPLLKSYDEVMWCLDELLTAEHDRKTVIVDSLDWLEQLIWDKICKTGNCTSIEEYGGGYGKGYIEAINVWREYLDKLDELNQKRGMAIIQIAHAQVKRYDNPETQGYDRINLKLQDGKQCTAAGTLFEWSDVVFFVNDYVGITKEALPGSSKKNPKERARAVGSGERVLYTQERPAFKAKSRYPLPEQIQFDREGAYWNMIKSFIPYYQPKGA